MKQILKSFNNFLDFKLINEIEVYVDASLKTQEPRWKTSLQWKQQIQRATSPVPILPLPDKFTASIHQTLKEKAGLTWEEATPPQQSQYYLYSPGGYIGWHDDAHYTFASILFLNPVWNIDWGGIFLYEDLEGLGLRGEVPTFNKCLVNAGGVPHGVSRLSPDAPWRRVIITFGLKTSESKLVKDKEYSQRTLAWHQKYNIGAEYVKNQALVNLSVAAERYAREKVREASVAYPDDGKAYRWNEETTSWDLVE